jgi:MPBQ/MSBQ methyltransferase
MTDDRTVWDDAYRRRGQRWAGAVPPLPVLPGHARVLELGCGNGKTFAALMKNGWDAVALDFSVTAVKTARSSFTTGQNGDAVLADARFLPFHPATFDAIFAWHIIGHMHEPDRVHIAREIGRLLKPGGIILFSEFSRKDFRYASGVPGEDGTFLRGNGISTHYFTEPESRALFTDCSCTSLREHHWELRVRGQVHARSEIQAIFTTLP